MSGKAIAMKSLKEKWLSIVQSAVEKGEKGIGGPSTVTAPTVGRRAPTLEQHPGSVETLTLMLKETVQQQRVLLNPEHPLFGILPYGELLARL